MDRSKFTTWDSVQHLWTGLNLPAHALDSLQLGGQDEVVAPSSFKVGHLAQSSIALSGLLAALVYSYQCRTKVPHVFIDRDHAVIEFASEKFFKLNGKAIGSSWGSIGGLHETSDGQVRVHDSFTNHYNAALRLLKCSPDADRAEFGSKVRQEKSLDLETAAVDVKAVIFARRSYQEWDSTPQARAVQDFPITIRKIAASPPRAVARPDSSKKCLTSLRVLEMSRVLAAPVAGRTLAAHGADVLWVTSPNLPDLPALDRDTSRGKRTVHIDLDIPAGRTTLSDLLKESDVFLQSYRPGSLQARGFSMETLLEQRGDRPLICASLSAWGTDGPWSERRGFDSIVQTASGMNVSEAEHYGDGSSARAMPCQALDHGAGYFLASGILVALHRQMTEGGSYQVDVSLAGVMKYLRSLGQYDGNSGFSCHGYEDLEDIPTKFVETKNSHFGEIQAIKHTTEISGLEIGWDLMPKPLGSDRPQWIDSLGTADTRYSI